MKSQNSNLILAVLPGNLSAWVSPFSPFQAVLKSRAVEWMEIPIHQPVARPAVMRESEDPKGFQRAAQ